MGSLPIAQFLIQRGARVNAKDRWGQTPLHEALVNRHLRMIKFLAVQHKGGLGLAGIELACYLNKIVMDEDLEMLQ